MKLSTRFIYSIFFFCILGFVYALIPTTRVSAKEATVQETGHQSVLDDGNNPGYSTVVDIEKQDESGNALNGATLQIVDSNNQVKETWVSDGTTHRTSLSQGEYTLHESSAPEGYEIGKDVSFKVDEPVHTTQTDLIGYQNWGIKKDWSYRIMTQEEAQLQKTDVGKIVYCVNKYKTYPSHNEYTQYEGTDEIIRSVMTVNIEDMDRFQSNLKRVLYYGYGSDVLGLQNMYKLTDNAFRKVTQYAVWYFTDHLITNIPDTPSSHGSYMIYNALVFGGMKVPDNLMMNVYIANDHHHQSLVGATLYQPLTVIMVNKKQTIPTLPEKPDVPDKPNTPSNKTKKSVAWIEPEKPIQKTESSKKGYVPVKMTGKVQTDVSNDLGLYVIATFISLSAIGCVWRKKSYLF